MEENGVIIFSINIIWNEGRVGISIILVDESDRRSWMARDWTSCRPVVVGSGLDWDIWGFPKDSYLEW